MFTEEEINRYVEENRRFMDEFRVMVMRTKLCDAQWRSEFVYAVASLLTSRSVE